MMHLILQDLSVNNAILLPPEGDCFMVEPASQSFDFTAGLPRQA